MLTVYPAFYLRPSKAGDVPVPIEGYWEATYEPVEWSTVIRPCPIAAAADCMGNALFWLDKPATVKESLTVGAEGSEE